MNKSRNIPDAPSSPAPQRSDSKEIVHAILEAARQLPVDASVKAIAERAGVGVASVYRYFPSRDAIYAELGRELHTQLLDEVTNRLRNVTTLEEGIAVGTELALQRSFGEQHIIEHVHLNLPSTWHNDIDTTRAIIEVVVFHLDRFVSGTPEQLHERAVMMMLLLRGSSRVAQMMPSLVPSTEVQVRLAQAAVLACVTEGLTRRPPG